VQNLVYVPVCAICRKEHLHCLEYNCHSSVLHPVTSVCRVTDVWYIPHTYSYLPTISPRWNDWDGTTILESVLHHEFKNTAYCHMICTFQICQNFCFTTAIRVLTLLSTFSSVTDHNPNIAVSAICKFYAGIWLELPQYRRL